MYTCLSTTNSIIGCNLLLKPWLKKSLKFQCVIEAAETCCPLRASTEWMMGGRITRDAVNGALGGRSSSQALSKPIDPAVGITVNERLSRSANGMFVRAGSKPAPCVLSD
jgi:hypothetical protein